MKNILCLLGLHWWKKYYFALLPNGSIGEFGEGIGVSEECRWCGKPKPAPAMKAGKG